MLHYLDGHPLILSFVLLCLALVAFVIWMRFTTTSSLFVDMETMTFKVSDMTYRISDIEYIYNQGSYASVGGDDWHWRQFKIVMYNGRFFITNKLAPAALAQTDLLEASFVELRYKECAQALECGLSLRFRNVSITGKQVSFVYGLEAIVGFRSYRIQENSLALVGESLRYVSLKRTANSKLLIALLGRYCGLTRI